jgi:hypothetical protein
MKKFPSELKQRFENCILRRLLAGADRSVNRKEGPETWFGVDNPYRCEAFGVIVALEIAGYGYIGADNLENAHLGFNLKFWFNEIQEKAKQLCLEKGPKEAYHWALENVSYE